MAARADECKKLERLSRYVSRPAVAKKRLSLTPNGNVRYRQKTLYRGGTSHVIFALLNFIARCLRPTAGTEKSCHKVWSLFLTAPCWLLPNRPTPLGCPVNNGQSRFKRLLLIHDISFRTQLEPSREWRRWRL